MSRPYVAFCAALLLSFLCAPSAHAASCAGADNPPSTGLTKARAATLCLLNEERAERNLPRLRTHRLLAAAARGHGHDMVDQGFFAHDSLDGSGFSSRIRSTGYLRRARTWDVGENLAWGTAKAASPTRIVAGWMASPSHRRNVLDPLFDEVGLAIVAGSPAAGRAVGSTYVTEFGRRN